MLSQHLLEIPARVTGGMHCNLLWSARHNDLSSLVSPFWAEIHDPVGTTDHIEVVVRRQENPEWACSLRSRKSQKPDSKPFPLISPKISH